MKVIQFLFYFTIIYAHWGFIQVCDFLSKYKKQHTICGPSSKISDWHKNLYMFQMTIVGTFQPSSDRFNVAVFRPHGQGLRNIHLNYHLTTMISFTSCPICSPLWNATKPFSANTYSKFLVTVKKLKYIQYTAVQVRQSTNSWDQLFAKQIYGLN